MVETLEPIGLNLDDIYYSDDECNQLDILAMISDGRNVPFYFNDEEFFFKMDAGGEAWSSPDWLLDMPTTYMDEYIATWISLSIEAQVSQSIRDRISFF
jgi:hypothetical protein